MHYDLLKVLNNIQQEFSKDFPHLSYSIYPKGYIDEYISKDVSYAVHIEPFPHESDIVVCIYYIDKESAYFVRRTRYEIGDISHQGYLIDTVDEIYKFIFNILEDLKVESSLASC